jgi:hypothetical protein
MEKLTKLEREFVQELNLEHGTKYKGEQLMEWSTGKIAFRKGEKLYFVKKSGVYVAIKLL